MKKALLSIFAVLTMVCIFALSASAYEHKYFSIDVPSDYEVTEESDGIQFEKFEEVLITINLSENNYTDFYNMSSAECSQWDQNMKSAYSSIGTITDYESEFDGNGSTASAMFYSFLLEDPDDASEIYNVEGMVYSEGGILYKILVLYSDDADYTEIESIVESLEFTPGSLGTSNSAYSYTSSDGVLSLTIPEEYSETDAPYPIDKMWMRGTTYAVAALVTDNTLHEQVANLDAAGIEKMKQEVAGGAGSAFQNYDAEQITANGFEGLRVYGDYVSGDTRAKMEIYMFTTYEKMYAVYFYDFGEAKADTYKNEILSSLEIDGELLGAGGSTQPSTEPSTQPSTQPVVPTAPADITEPADEITTAAPEKDEQEDKDEDKEDKDNTTLYIVIGAVVLIVIVAIIAIVIISNNKKKAALNTVPQYAQPFNPQQQYPQNPTMNNYDNNGGFGQNNNNF